MYLAQNQTHLEAIDKNFHFNQINIKKSHIENCQRVQAISHVGDKVVYCHKN
jgi:hypothetical protein